MGTVMIFLLLQRAVHFKDKSHKMDREVTGLKRMFGKDRKICGLHFFPHHLSLLLPPKVQWKNQELPNRALFHVTLLKDPPGSSSLATAKKLGFLFVIITKCT